VVNDEAVPAGESRKGPRGDIADVGTILVERDARAHLLDVVFDEICIRARDARL
jgi:hypothetical protein